VGGRESVGRGRRRAEPALVPARRRR
jgi:hypothetical protein